ncbi:MAG: MBL fold metallo-hydrolase [Desulfobulbaceae bacterium]
MRICVLGSGSRGNCTLVEAGETVLLIDNGFSGAEIRRRLCAIGRGPEMLTAILVTHEHNDHVAGVGVLSRQASVPVYANPATHGAAEGRMGKVFTRRDFGTGEPFVINDLRIHPFAVSHDTADPVGFVLSDGRCRVGYCTDTGKITTLIEHHLRGCHALVLESNHDPQMLRDGPYPPKLQQRVRSSQGHLANEDAGKFLKKIAGGNSQLRQVVLAHLSETNNLPNLAMEAVRMNLAGDFERLRIIAAGQNRPCALLDVGFDY